MPDVRRTAFGKKLSEYPLQNGVLYDQEIRVRGCLAILLETSFLLSLVEIKKASETQKAMNSVLVLITKIFCAKESIKVISEGLEAFGGVGYLEDSGLPAFFRNTQVLMIWEGTTNVLCLEFAKTLHVLGQSGLESIAQYLRYAIDMAYLHPSEILYEKQETFNPFQKVVYLYNAIMPLLSQITDSKRSLLG